MGIRESSKDNEEDEVCRLEQTLPCSVSPLLDSALGSSHFKSESWTNIKGGLSVRITQVLDYELDFLKDLGNPFSQVWEILSG